LARESYETALSYAPGLYQTYLSLIQIDLMERNLNLALQQAQKVIELQPNNPQSWYVAGIVLAEAGQTEEATKVFRKSLEFDPAYGPSLEALKKISQQP
jgi:Flp pilus assembly protein TadD